MQRPPPTKTTELLRQMGAGNQASGHQLFSLLYDELRALAQAQLRRDRPGHTLQATALVNEVWLKLIDVTSFGDGDAASARGHFIGCAARAMRQVLVDHARQHKAKKRGGEGACRVALDEAFAADGIDIATLLDLDGAIEGLAAEHPHLGRVAELRLFGGLSTAEIGVLLGRSLTRTKVDWSLARAILSRQLAAGSG